MNEKYLRNVLLPNKTKGKTMTPSIILITLNQVFAVLAF